MNRNKKVVSIIVAVVILVVALALIYVSLKGSPGNLEPITVGSRYSVSSGLLLIAENQSFFARNGLSVSIREYVSGALAIEGLMKDEVDVAFSTEYPIVTGAFNNADARIISTVDKYEAIYVVANREQEIRNASDLVGKKIGVSFGTITEFYLARYLELNGLQQNDITRVNLQPAQFAEALINGTIDALATTQERLTGELQQRLGPDAVYLPLQVGQPAFWSVSAKGDLIANYPETLKKFLRALEDAEVYLINHPSESRSMVEQRLNVTADHSFWSDHFLSLSLDQSLLTAMNDEARWIIANRSTNQTRIPDLSTNIYTNALNEVKPESVTIFG